MLAAARMVATGANGGLEVEHPANTRLETGAQQRHRAQTQEVHKKLFGEPAK